MAWVWILVDLVALEEDRAHTVEGGESSSVAELELMVSLAFLFGAAAGWV